MKSKKFVIDLKKCTGCFGCKSICKFNAIEVVQKNGFYYPTINVALCKQCKQCLKICPVFKNLSNSYQCRRLFSCSSKEMYWKKECSSGGIFGILSDLALKNKYYVCGTIFKDDFSGVQKIISNSVDSIKLMRGSKYVQSDFNNKYAEIKSLLDSETTVLYCGLPCEVAGLKSYLGRNYANLYTIDFVCHGIPSPTFFNYFIKKESKNKKIQFISFRKKDGDFPTQKINFGFADGSFKSIPSLKTYYFYLFLKNYSLRRSCYCCDQQKMCLSDLTISDDWKRSNLKNFGVSLVSINSEKGDMLFNSISNHLTFKKIDSDEINILKKEHQYPIYKYKIASKLKIYKHPLTAKMLYHVDLYINRVYASIVSLVLKLVKHGKKNA